MVLVAVILLLAGVFAWSMVGTLEIKTEVMAIVSDHTAQVIALDPETLAEGMPLHVGGQDYLIIRMILCHCVIQLGLHQPGHEQDVCRLDRQKMGAAKTTDKSIKNE